MRRLVMLGRKFPSSPTRTVRIANDPAWDPIHEGNMNDLLAGVDDPDLERKIKLETESDR